MYRLCRSGNETYAFIVPSGVSHHRPVTDAGIPETEATGGCGVLRRRPARAPSGKHSDASCVGFSCDVGVVGEFAVHVCE